MIVSIFPDMQREFGQIIVIGSDNPCLQLKIHYSMLVPEMELSDRTLSPPAEKNACAKGFLYSLV